MFKFIKKFRTKSKLVKGAKSFKKNNFNNALKFFNEALEIMPDCKYGFLFIGGVYEAVGDNNNALEYYDKAISIDHHYISGWTAKITLLSSLFEYNSAMKIVEEGLRLNKDDLSLLFHKTVLFINCKKYNHALKIATYNSKVHPDSKEVIHMEANVLSLLGDHELAIDCFMKLTKLCPFYSLGWYGMGVEYYNLNDFDNAIKFFKKAIEIEYSPYFVSSYIYLLNKLGDDDKTLESINKFFKPKRNIKDNEGNNATIFFISAKIMEKKCEFNTAIENYEKAIKCFEIAIKNYEENPQIHSKILVKNQIDADLDYWKRDCVNARNSLKKLKLHSKEFDNV